MLQTVIMNQEMVMWLEYMVKVQLTEDMKQAYLEYMYFKQMIEVPQTQI